MSTLKESHDNTVGYLERIGNFSTLGDNMSKFEDTIIHVGDIMGILGDFQYIRGNHEYIASWDFQYVGGIP